MPIPQIPKRGEADYPILKIYYRLLSYFGPQGWWPGDTEFEIMVGAILTQNTSWRNVEKAISALKENNFLNPRALSSLSIERLSALIRSSGFFRIKAERLSSFVKYLMERYKGDVGRMRKVDTETLRRELLKIKGVGPETADSILLYALNRPVFVIDSYTRRVFSRHNYITGKESYEKIQEFFIKNLPKDPRVYNEYHALLVRLAKTYCRNRPLCKDCPLNENS